MNVKVNLSIVLTFIFGTFSIYGGSSALNADLDRALAAPFLEFTRINSEQCPTSLRQMKLLQYQALNELTGAPISALKILQGLDRFLIANGIDQALTENGHSIESTQRGRGLHLNFGNGQHLTWKTVRQSIPLDADGKMLHHVYTEDGIYFDWGDLSDEETIQAMHDDIDAMHGHLEKTRTMEGFPTTDIIRFVFDLPKRPSLANVNEAYERLADKYDPGNVDDDDYKVKASQILEWLGQAKQEAENDSSIPKEYAADEEGES